MSENQRPNPGTRLRNETTLSLCKPPTTEQHKEETADRSHLQPRLTKVRLIKHLMDKFLFLWNHQFNLLLLMSKKISLRRRFSFRLWPLRVFNVSLTCFYRVFNVSDLWLQSPNVNFPPLMTFFPPLSPSSPPSSSSLLLAAETALNDLFPLLSLWLHLFSSLCFSQDDFSFTFLYFKKFLEKRDVISLHSQEDIWRLI